MIRYLLKKVTYTYVHIYNYVVFWFYKAEWLNKLIEYLRHRSFMENRNTSQILHG